MSSASLTAYKWIGYGAWSVLIGILLSGPIGMLVISLTKPQPAWQLTQIFAANYHWIQAFPYFAGFLIIIGFLLMMIGLYETAEPELRFHALAALVFTTIFATLISLNYIFQTTFVPALLSTYARDRNEIVSAFTMANPNSLGWALEMWGYGFLGVATWFASKLFGESKLERATTALLIVNGITSIASALWTAIDSGWVLTTAGLVGYVVWNVLILAIAVLVLLVTRQRRLGLLS